MGRVFSATIRPALSAGKQPEHILGRGRVWVCPILGLDEWGKCHLHRVSIHVNIKIKNSFKVTRKQETKNTAEKANNIIKLKYLSSLFPLFFIV